jgi:phosphate acetyltransferase
MRPQRKPQDRQENTADIPFYRKLIGKGAQPAALKTAVVMPVDERSLKGAVEAVHKDMITPVLIGPEDEIRKTAEEHSLDIGQLEIEDCANEQEASQRAVELAAQGRVEAIMKGHLPTHILLKAVVQESQLRTGRNMSHVFALAGKDYPKPLFISDAALNIDPTLEEKRNITQNAIDLFRCLGFGTPKVALLSATEHVTSDIPDTIEAAAICKMADRGAITGGIVEGPLAFDNAISKKAAEAKGIKSKVAGEADILIVPDLQSGNMLYKQMRYLAGYEAAGIVMGARIPVILTSRAATTPTRLASCALALMVAEQGAQERREPVEIEKRL